MQKKEPETIQMDSQKGQKEELARVWQGYDKYEKIIFKRLIIVWLFIGLIVILSPKWFTSILAVREVSEFIVSPIPFVMFHANISPDPQNYIFGWAVIIIASPIYFFMWFLIARYQVFECSRRVKFRNSKRKTKKLIILIIFALLLIILCILLVDSGDLKDPKVKLMSSGNLAVATIGQLIVNCFYFLLSYLVVAFMYLKRIKKDNINM